MTVILNQKTFIEWYKRNYKSENIVINKNVIIYWFKWIAYDEYMYWLDGKHPKNLNCLSVKRVKINQTKLPMKIEKESIKIIYAVAQILILLLLVWHNARFYLSIDWFDKINC